MGEAYRIAKAEMHAENVRIRALHDRMLAGLDHWVKAADAGHLAWGILHFRKGEL
jgi:cysteine sulfinate desulfinase/cysteine desulfurase-like protein